MGFCINKTNYDHFKEVARIIWEEEFAEVPLQLPPECLPMNVLGSWEMKSPALARKGLQEGLRDSVSSFPHLPKELVQRIDQRLKAAGLTTVVELKCVVQDTLKKVLKRGRIRNLDEFCIVKEVLDDLASPTSSLDRVILEKAMGDFESSAVLKTRNRQ